MPAAMSVFFGFRTRRPVMSSYDTLTLAKPAASNQPISSRSSHPTSVPHQSSLAGLVIVLDFTPLRLKPLIESAGAHSIPYLLPDLVDGLEDGRPAPGLQHPV